VKRLVDVVGAAFLLAVLAVPMLAVAAVVRASSRGPALYRQERVGRGDRCFRMWKFRTMRADADLRRAELTDLDEAAGPLFKMRKDPRVTRVGAVLRRWSLDELPQLLNVLAGQMSLVGPRPPLRTEVECYELEERRRLDVTPGMTGLWQVNGRSDVSWGEAVRLDLFYVENRSLALDVRILCKTVPAVLRGTGAY
jgi:lipopolysaccharide/colanic/teichoic acid biosynthesis glycosyltransferase